MCVCVCVDSLRFTQAIMSSVNKDSFMYSFLICILFLSFSCFIALVGLSV